MYPLWLGCRGGARIWAQEMRLGPAGFREPRMVCEQMSDSFLGWLGNAGLEHWERERKSQRLQSDSQYQQFSRE